MARIPYIPSNPSCHQIEVLNATLQRIPKDDPIVLSLARKTGAKFFSESSIAQLIAHLSRRSGKLVIRDTHNSWLPAHYYRFTSKIDGVAALVYSNLISTGRLENVKKLAAPDSLFTALKSRLLVSGCLEDAGPTRTFTAIDPDYPTPAELGRPQVRKSDFHNIVRSTLSQYENRLKGKSYERRRAEDRLISFVYETFQNTIEHGRFTKNNDLIDGIRYLRLHVYVDNSISDLLRRAVGFPELQQFIERTQRQRSTVRFVELAVADAGQGITSHYLNSRSPTAPAPDDRAQVLQELIDGRLSSKRSMSGVGLGLPNAMSALRELKAFFSLRTEEFWLYRDYSDQDSAANVRPPLHPVSKIKSIAPLAGTQFNVLIDFPR